MASNYFRTWPNRLPCWLLKLLFNLYLPYFGTGIWLKTLAPDFRFAQVIMKMHWYNKNLVGTHFGGSMFAMVDPFPMLLLMKNLGSDYLVWDKAASIDFKKPGIGTLTSTCSYSPEEIAAIRQKADTESKTIFDHTMDILNADGVVVATVVKTLYVSKRNR